MVYVNLNCTGGNLTGVNVVPAAGDGSVRLSIDRIKRRLNATNYSVEPELVAAAAKDDKGEPRAAREQVQRASATSSPSVSPEKDEEIEGETEL